MYQIHNKVKITETRHTNNTHIWINYSHTMLAVQQKNFYTELQYTLATESNGLRLLNIYTFIHNGGSKCNRHQLDKGQITTAVSIRPLYSHSELIYDIDTVSQPVHIVGDQSNENLHLKPNNLHQPALTIRVHLSTTKYPSQ